MSIVEVIGVHRRYASDAEEVHALRDVSFSIDGGAFVAVEGPSGCGKSTLLHLLAGIDTPTTGTVLVDGHIFSALNDTERTKLRRTTIGLVLPIVDLIPTLTVWENVALPALLGGARLEQCRAQSVAVLERLGLVHKTGASAARLSAGEAQRTAVARALFANPAVLIADEPTSSLDSVRSDELLGLLRTLADGGQTIILATHDARVASYADYSLRLVDGTLLEAEDH